MLSFVIPAYNEELLIARTIRSIRVSADPLGEPYEIIVADDASDDRTGEIARGLGAVVVREEHRQIAATRNAGARIAKGDLLVFVDADTIVSEQAVRGALEAIRRGAIGGGARVEFDGDVARWVHVALAPMMWLYFAMRLAPGCFFFVTRDAFERVGGFNERMYAGEETDLALRLRKLGRMEMVRGRVITSGRKVRAHSAGELGRVLFWSMLRGRRGLASRDGLDLWYGERRVDPDPAVGDEAMRKSAGGTGIRSGA